jgi:hypothetical protein
VKLQNWVTALLGRLKKKASLADMRPGDFVFKSPRRSDSGAEISRTPFQAVA